MQSSCGICVFSECLGYGLNNPHKIKNSFCVTIYKNYLLDVKY